MPESKRWKILAALGLAAVTFAAYLPVLECGFIWDDDHHVTENPALRSLDGLRRIWFEPGATPQYYPLVHSLFWIERRCWGLDPMGYHAVNVLLHAAGALLLWRVLARFGLGGAAWAAAALFALHPVQVESVAWISERKNCLLAPFFFGSLLAFISWNEERKKSRYAASLGLYLLALFSKTVACTLPVILLAVLGYRWGRLRWRDLKELSPFFVFGLAFGLMTVWLERHRVGALGPEWDLALLDRFLLASKAVWFYLGKLLFPVDLSFIYPRWIPDAADWRGYIAPSALAAGLALLWILRRRIGRAPFTAAIVYLAALGPALGFFNLYPMRYGSTADHFQYLAAAAPLALAAGLGRRLAMKLGSRGRRAALAMAVLLLVLFASLTWRQARIYENPERLWRHTLERNPEAWIAHTILAEELRKKGEAEEALRLFCEALRIQESLPEKIDLAQALNNVGIALVDLGRIEEGTLYYGRALEADPGYPMAHHNLGVLDRSRGDLEGAIAHFRAALERKPDYLSALFNLGDTLFMKGVFDEAAACYLQVLAFRPDHVGARENLQKALNRKTMERR